MSDEQIAQEGATPAAPVENVAQETPQISANADGQNEDKPDERPRDEKGRFVQERINELTRARRQAERERDAYAAQLQQYQSQQHQVPAGDKPPSFENYTDLNEWAVAVAEHARQQAANEARREFEQRQQQSSQQQVFGQYEAKEREYVASHPDYPEALEALSSSVRFSPAVLEVIAASDHGPAVVHHLGQHLDVADRLARLPPHLAAFELARIEAKVSAPKPVPVTKAPPPAPSVGGGSPVAKDPDRMSVDEWQAWRQSQLNKR